MILESQFTFKNEAKGADEEFYIKGLTSGFWTFCREIGQDLAFFFFFDQKVLISMDFDLLAQFLLRNLAVGVLRDR